MGYVLIGLVSYGAGFVLGYWVIGPIFYKDK
jgi:hypothetical protein